MLLVHWLTCGPPLRHPLVILAGFNLCSSMLFIYLEAVVLQSPPGRLPYAIQALVVPIMGWSPIYLYTHPRELTRDLFNRPPESRLPDDRPKGGFGRAFAWVFTIFITVISGGAAYESWLKIRSS